MPIIINRFKPLFTSFSVQPLKLVLLLFVGIYSGFISTSACALWNNPYADDESGKNTFYSSFSERPKFLDPVRSYSESEYRFLGQIYEPPLQYHYLHRPYQLEPQTLTKMPDIVYLDTQSNELANANNPESIAFTEYRFTLKPGIKYQPHPAFAKDTNGDYRYHKLTLADTQPIKTIDQLEYTGTRELIASDYIHQIKRIAHPNLHSPINGLMQNYIVGLKTLSDELKKTLSKTEKPIDLRKVELAGVTSSHKYQFTIRIKGQYPQFIYWLAMPFFAPMPWEADTFYEQPGFSANNINLNWYPIGTGAYMLSENNPNLKMVLDKNPNFHRQTYPTTGDTGDKEKGLLKDAGKVIPFIDKAVYLLEKESIPYWNKFLQGYFDSSGISSDSFDSAVNLSATGTIDVTEKMQAKGISLKTTVNTSTIYLGFNMLDPVVGGSSSRARLLRQAISIAVDYDEYISIFLNGRGIAGQGPIPPGIFGYQEAQQGINPITYDWRDNKSKRKSIEQARALLTEANYKNGIDGMTKKPLSLFYESIDQGPDSKAKLNWLRKQLAKIDIQLIIRSTDYNRFREKMSKGNVQLFNWGWNADYPDPENFLFLLYGPQGKVKHKGENAVNYANPEFDRLFNTMKNIPNSQARQNIINKMVAIVQYDAPWIFAYHPKSFSLQHAWFKNTKPFIMSNTGTLKYKRIDTEQRYSQREEWNKPVVWPMVLLLLLVMSFIIPAYIAYQKYDRRRAL